MTELLRDNQLEAIRKHFEAKSQDESILDNHEKEIAGVVAGNIKIWQERAGDSNPADFRLAFGHSRFEVTLRQVLALVPEQFQNEIVLLGSEHSGSWLDETVMNLLIHLSNSAATNTHFARGPATDSNLPFNTFANGDGFNTRLAYLMDQTKQNLPDWNANNIYTVPEDTERIVCFWNYYGNHWTVLSVDITAKKWFYNIYDSRPLSNLPKRASSSWVWTLATWFEARPVSRILPMIRF